MRINPDILAASDPPPDRDDKMPHWVWFDGKKYYLIPLLAARRGISPQALRKWIKSRPHLTHIHNGHTYVRER